METTVAPVDKNHAYRVGEAISDSIRSAPWAFERTKSAAIGAKAPLPRFIEPTSGSPLKNMTLIDPPEERVIYRERLQSVEFDFRGKS